MSLCMLELIMNHEQWKMNLHLHLLDSCKEVYRYATAAAAAWKGDWIKLNNAHIQPQPEGRLSFCSCSVCCFAMLHCCAVVPPHLIQHTTTQWYAAEFWIDGVQPLKTKTFAPKNTMRQQYTEYTDTVCKLVNKKLMITRMLIKCASYCLFAVFWWRFAVKRSRCKYVRRNIVSPRLSAQKEWFNKISQ